MLNKKALAASVSAGPSEYVEDVFSTYLYSGTGATLSINNGIDLAGEGGLTWIKMRDSAENHKLTDTVRGTTKSLESNTTAAQGTEIDGLTAFNSNGFSLGADAEYNFNTGSYCSWTFRKQPKFFDVVTYTGNGTARTIAHNLGSVPGMIIVKRTDQAADWQVYHRSLANTEYLVLNTTAAKATGTTRWNSTTPTSTEFSLGNSSTVNANTGTYVAYLFAHDAGGFGDAGTDNIISCGSFTSDGSGNFSVNLGYEPQYLLIKRTDSSTGGGWMIVDAMRGLAVDSGSNTNSPAVFANTSNAEQLEQMVPTSTGFTITSAGGSSIIYSNASYIYMAIRRPMKTPTSGTEVFSPILTDTNDPTGTKKTTNFVIDSQWQYFKSASSTNTTRTSFNDRLRGVSTSSTESGNRLVSSSTGSEITANASTRGWDNTGFVVPSYWGATDVCYHNFRRATGFFDIVCYTGDSGAATDKNHNLGVVPELIIMKRRNTTGGWIVWRTATGTGNTWGLLLNTTAVEADQGAPLMSALPTSTTFKPALYGPINSSGNTFVAYLFASVAGVSKVGSYTGNGSNQTINCGFTAGARFVLIKRTDSTGDWCVFDTARGIVSGNDPFLQLNTTDAEVTGEDAVDPDNSGFIVNETTEALNTNNATYIYLAIA